MATLVTVEVPIDRDFDQLCDVLDRDAVDVLREVFHAPTAEERHVTVAATGRVGGLSLRSDVEVEVDPVVRHSRYDAQLLVRWRALRHRIAIPSGRATLHVTALSGGPGARSALSVATEFEPALGPIGDLEFAIEGRSRLQRAVEARLRAFVAALRARIPAGG